MRIRSQAIALAMVLLTSLSVAFISGRRSFLMPGVTSDGHHLFDQDCNACHTAFAGVGNASCVACHEAELTEDSHAVSLFADPRWAADLARLDATRCVTCHREHRVATAGVTVPREFCYPCHDDVAARRPDHRTLAPASCGDAGCHNYHDNARLNRAFLVRHLREPAVLPGYRLPDRWLPATPPGARERAASRPSAALVAAVAACGQTTAGAIQAAWAGSAHARLGVDCDDCHLQPSRRLRLHPGAEACTRCHAGEVAGFGNGLHGVRTRLGLPPLTPAEARLAMKPPTGRPVALGCSSCHDPHTADTRPAAVEACLRCHDDRHSRLFKGSPHATLGDPLTDPERPGPRTVTCATCHMPRRAIRREGRPWTTVDHDNTANLHPNDRMAGEVCSHCHGFELSLAAVLDRRLIANNFRGRPARGLLTFAMVRAASAVPH